MNGFHNRAPPDQLIKLISIPFNFVPISVIWAHIYGEGEYRVQNSTLTNSTFSHWASLSKHYNLHPGPTGSQSWPHVARTYMKRSKVVSLGWLKLGKFFHRCFLVCCLPESMYGLAICVRARL